MLVIDRIYHFISSDTELTLKIQKNRKQNLSSNEYIRMFGYFDIFQCYDIHALYSL